MKTELQKMMNEFLTKKHEEYAGNPFAHYVRHNIPKIIKEQSSLSDQYFVKASVGQDKWVAIPWIGIFKKNITMSAQRGYYIVYIFRTDMSGVYLSLNMGWTQFAKEFGTKEAKQRILSTAIDCKNILDSVLEDFSLDPIQLKPSSDMGEGYELGHICGKYYSKDNVPDDTVLIDDLRNLIGVYRELEGYLRNIDIVHMTDPSIGPIISQSRHDDEIYNDLLQLVAPKYIPNTPHPPVPPVKTKGGSKYKGDPGIGKACIISAGYKCELNTNHKTFVSKSSQEYYVEAHHIIPLSKQSNYKNSLDMPGNIMALCPNCHKMIHLGNKEEVQPPLEKIFKSREKALEEAGLPISLDNLFNYY